MPRPPMILFAPIALLACSNDTGAPADNAAFAANESQIAPVDRPPFTVQPMAEFDEPWAMAFLPDGRLLVTEKAGALKLYSPSSGTVTDVAGVAFWT